MPAPRKITDEYRQIIAAVAYLRRLLPSDKQLAREIGCSKRGVRSFMERLEPNHFSDHAAIAALMTVSRGSSSGIVPEDGCSRPNRI